MCSNWTMMPDDSNFAYVWYIDSNGDINSTNIGDKGYNARNDLGIRPVINLLKTAIPSQE